jgi:2OG-Fe(II) oxygenase superfamily/Glycosyltransferase (GlcNAc)
MSVVFAAVLCRPSFVFDWRCRFVCQPGNGARYVRHVDVVPPDDPSESMRKVTVLYYLNSEWMESRDGGALRLFLSSSSEEVSLDIFPHADRMLAFLSDVIPHEVLPAFATRYSVTVWLYGTAGSGFRRSSPLRTLSPRPSLGVDASDSIFVTIPCYRDTECQHTVQSLFAQAARPDRVFVGICWQLDESDEQSCCNHSVFTSRRHQAS